MHTVFVPNLDIAMCIWIPGLKRVTQSPLLPGMVFVPALDSVQEARPWLEIAGKVDLVQRVRPRMILGGVESRSCRLDSFLQVDSGRHFVVRATKSSHSSTLSEISKAGISQGRGLAFDQRKRWHKSNELTPVSPSNQRAQNQMNCSGLILDPDWRFPKPLKVVSLSLWLLRSSSSPRW